MTLFAGNSNRFWPRPSPLSQHPWAEAASARFAADQEIFVEIQENVRGEDVFASSHVLSGQRHLMELAHHDRCVCAAPRRAASRR
jgi:ribose-phosphate pyrophosphokinase